MNTPGTKFFERIFTRALQKNHKGALHVFRMDGTSFILGNPLDEQPAIIQVKHPRFFFHVVLFGEVGFGEAYMLGYFETPDLYRTLDWFVQNSGSTPTMGAAATQNILVGLLGFYNRVLHLLRPNSEKTARENIAHHYDIGNDLYQKMLDPTMAYSAALFASANSDETLEQAQIRKFERICRLLQLRKGMHLLEIGSGFGGFAIYAARNYGVRVTTITISAAQYRMARERISSDGLLDQIQLLLTDFRRLEGRYDRIVSIEMAEALGQRFLDAYFEKIGALLEDDGLALIQYINYPESRYDRYAKSSDFIQKHIFPGGLLLSHREVLNSLHRTNDLCLYDLASFGLSYARSLREWRANFSRWIAQSDSPYNQTFIRKWIYYLISCEVAFARRYINVCQILLSRPQNPNLQDSGP